MAPKVKTWRSVTHLQAVRARPCCICRHGGGGEPNEAHHFAGSRGTGIKAADAFTVPLCHFCHSSWHNSARVGELTKEQTLAVFWRECAEILIERLTIEIDVEQ